jgi:hypothetical protein
VAPAYETDDLLLHERGVEERVEVELDEVVDEGDSPGSLLVPVPAKIVVVP